MLKNASKPKSFRKPWQKSGEAHAQQSVAASDISIRMACRIFSVSETCYRNQSVLRDENADIADWIIQLTTDENDWGFSLCFDYLRNVKGKTWNHKRVYRIYCELA